MACTDCKGIKKVTNKVTNIVEGYKHIIIKDPIVEVMYEDRMNSCRVCTKRIILPIAKISVCKICGCVIEAKARVKDEHCPDVPARW